ncbi:MAG TPA: hypothetical protein VJ654_00735 [Noviherbaspirillum sp.]|nr:hypothetical protein [Noviherbaspirillum sp.]
MREWRSLLFSGFGLVLSADLVLNRLATERYGWAAMWLAITGFQLSANIGQLKLK